MKPLSKWPARKLASWLGFTRGFTSLPLSQFINGFSSQMRFAVLVSAFLAGATVGVGAASTTLTVQAGQPGVVISSNLFGIFFEELSSAGDGGLYAELVRNRSFEGNSNNPDYWSLVTSGTATGTMNLDTSLPLSPSNRTSLRLTLTGGSGAVGAANRGYWGIPIASGETYNLGFFARCSSGFQSSIIASLESSNGAVVYEASPVTGLVTNWRHFTATFTPGATDPSARLVLRIFQPGTVWLDFVSLFPAHTFNNRTNGLRPDLANMLVNLHPSFVRFPGGAWVDGAGVPDFYNWEVTVGNPANRQPRWDLWGYMVDNGLGYEEYLEMCEDLHAAPLFVVNCGMDYSTAVPTNQLGPYIQEALDAIEYANGSTNTYWGAQRAANGHPAPFDLQYMEIGNENSGSAYNDHYAWFYDAIKSRYPQIKLIADTPVTSRPMDIVDEHYYPSTAWFEQNAGHYDNYSRNGPKIFVGEYAARSGAGNGNLAGALSEAAWMTGMERNSDVVVMASYAPLFANLNNKDWNPDLIYFNGTQVYGTPSYYVQQMFSQNRGDIELPVSVSPVAGATNAVMHGAIGLGSWNTSVQYTNIVVTSNSVTLYQSDFAANGTNGWRVYNGAWSANAGLYQQTNLITDCRATTGDTNWANYTITLRARKVSGSEGFLILFNWLDDNDWTWWNIGGWGNTLDAIEQMSGGTKSTISSSIPETIATGVWYDIRIVLTGPRIQCYLNNQLIQDITYPDKRVFASSSYDKASGQIIVKAVNVFSQPLDTTFHLEGVNSISPTGTVVQLTSAHPSAENSLAAPMNVFPVTNTISGVSTNFTLTLPANSLSILRLQANGINFITNLWLQVPSLITNGVSVAANVWGQQSGNWINLTTNSNHALTYASADTNVATVDATGHVTGVGAGTTSIVASYPALGLSTTQAVQVIYVPPPPVSLVHRYSFSETSGTNVADSIGGPAWNGTLPRGGTFGNGRLTFSSASRQFLNLPGGILSNDAATTIEMWISSISGTNTSPPFVYLFAFGNTDSNGAGYDYIFFNPNLARTTISAADPGYNGEQGGNLSASLGSVTNLHLTCVFDCPNGVIRVYTNGVLAGMFTGIADSLSTVGNQFAYIGRSLYTDDAYLTWTIDELRIYDGALSANDVAATQMLGPNQLLSASPPAISAIKWAGGFMLSWPAAASSFTVMTTTNLASGNWTPADVTPHLVGPQWRVNVSPSDSPRYFRLQK